MSQKSDGKHRSHFRPKIGKIGKLAVQTIPIFCAILMVFQQLPALGICGKREEAAGIALSGTSHSNQFKLTSLLAVKP